MHLPHPALTPTAMHSRAPADPLAHLPPTDRALFRARSFGPQPTHPVRFPVVHHAFEHHAATQPDAPAVTHPHFNEALTYAQLDRRANRLARRLRSAGVGPDKRVCVLGRRGCAFVAGVLGVLKAGGQYVPLDAVTITDATLAYVLRDARPAAVLVMHEFAHRLPPTLAVPAINVERALEEDERRGVGAERVEDWSSPHDGAYVIYTSGTTGVPKGVDVRHRGVTNVISAPPGNVHMAPGLRVAHLLNIAFDMGAWEVLGALYNGCELRVRGNTAAEWRECIRSSHVLIATPSILARHDPAEYGHRGPRGGMVRAVIVGGEPCPQALADAWARYTAFHNCCGPTEISICNTIQPHTLDPTTGKGKSVSIGRPLARTNVYILDADFEPSSPASLSSPADSSSHDSPTDSSSRPSDAPRALRMGETGSMWVGGIGVSRGYLNLPDKTRERYLPDPFVDPGAAAGWLDAEGGEVAVMFNTGDLGRWGADGELEHCGRRDDQVKVKGFRVELDGVASAMRNHPAVTHATALLLASELWGFVSPASVDLSAVRAETARGQPYYAVPSQWVALDKFPVTRNGKVDKRALAEVALSRTERAAKDGAPELGAPALGVEGGPKQRLAVHNCGVPFSASLPGTPMYLSHSFAAAAAAVREEKWIAPPSPALSLSTSTASVSRSPSPETPGEGVEEGQILWAGKRMHGDGDAGAGGEGEGGRGRKAFVLGQVPVPVPRVVIADAEGEEE